MTQQTKAASETGVDSSSAPLVQDSVAGTDDGPGSLGKVELAVIGEFFELLAKWDEREGARGC